MLKKQILFGLLMLLVFGVGFAQSNPQPPEQNTKDATTTCKNKTCPDNPPITVNVSPAQTVNEHPYRDTHHEKNERHIANATVALAVITAFLALFTGFLWNSTRELVKDASKTSKIELRAYLGVGDTGIKFLTSNLHLQARVEVINTGKTPAKYVTQAIEFEIRDPADDKIFPAGKRVGAKRPIAPGGSWRFRREKFITEEQYTQIVNKEKMLFVWGKAEYIDVFDEPQSLDFRYQNHGIIFTTTDGIQNIIGWALYPEEEGNDAT